MSRMAAELALFLRLYQKEKKAKRGEMDLSLTIRLLANPVYVPKMCPRVNKDVLSKCASFCTVFVHLVTNLQQMYCKEIIT